MILTPAGIELWTLVEAAAPALSRHQPNQSFPLGEEILLGGRLLGNQPTQGLGKTVLANTADASPPATLGDCPSPSRSLGIPESVTDAQRQACPDLRS